MSNRERISHDPNNIQYSMKKSHSISFSYRKFGTNKNLFSFFYQAILVNDQDITFQVLNCIKNLIQNYSSKKVKKDNSKADKLTLNLAIFGIKITKLILNNQFISPKVVHSVLITLI